MFRKRMADMADPYVRVRIGSHTPDTYSGDYREFLLTPSQAFDLLRDLRIALEASPYDLTTNATRNAEVDAQA